MGRKLDTVIAFYRDGVADGHIGPATDKYLAPGFVDHTQLGATGMRSLIDTYEPLVHRFRDRFVWPVRGFEDGSKVFLHSYQSFGRGQIGQVCADVFDTDEENQVTARWNVTTPVVRRTRSGRSQIDGPSVVMDVGLTSDNKCVVGQFVTDVLIRGDAGKLERYLDPDDYAEHSPDIPDGIVGFRRHLELRAAAGRPVRYRTITLMVGRGNYVATLSTAGSGGEAYRVFDLFRLAGGRIVEHWETAPGLGAGG